MFIQFTLSEVGDNVRVGYTGIPHGNDGKRLGNSKFRKFTNVSAKGQKGLIFPPGPLFHFEKEVPAMPLWIKNKSRGACRYLSNLFRWRVKRGTATKTLWHSSCRLKGNNETRSVWVSFFRLVQHIRFRMSTTQAHVCFLITRAWGYRLKKNDKES